MTSTNKDAAPGSASGGPEFSLHELAVASDSGWIITKHRIIEKVYRFFGSLCDEYRTMIDGCSDVIPQEVRSVSPKIYRGEQYRQMPYVMMDYPRYFQRDDIFAIRSFFWWGNHFSIHLLLGGKFRDLYAEKIGKKLAEGRLPGYYFALPENPWQHHFERDNYIPAAEFPDAQKTPGPHRFIKVGSWLPLAESDVSGEFFRESYRKILALLHD